MRQIRLLPTSRLALFFVALTPVFAAGACASSETVAVAPMTTSTTAPPPATATAVAPKEWKSGGAGIDEVAMDTSVDACADFYEYACGNWIKNTPIPDDQSRWGRGQVLAEKNETKLREVLEGDMASSSAPGVAPSGAYAKKLGDYYASCMDEAGIEKAGSAPLRPYLAEIATVHDPASFTKATAWFHDHGLRMFFDFDAEQDSKDATQEIGVISQGGLGLPDRDYYLKDDAKSKDIQAKYLEHLERSFGLLGEPPARATADAATVMRMETDLAKASMPRAERREPTKRYHKVPVADLTTAAPKFLWTDYFRDVGQPQLASLNVEHMAFVSAFAQFDGHWPDVQTYMKWHVLRGLTPYLPKRFVDEDFKMRSALTGAPKILPRWKRDLQGPRDRARIGRADRPRPRPQGHDRAATTPPSSRANGTQDEIKGRTELIRREIKTTDSEYDREKLQERLAKLAGGVAQINVGAATETEMKERKALVEDALHATRAAIEEGIVPGGGTALIRATKAIDGLGLKATRRSAPPSSKRRSSSSRPVDRRERRDRRRCGRGQDHEVDRRQLRLQRRQGDLGRHVRRRDRRPHQGHPLGPPERRIRRRPPPDDRSHHRREERKEGRRRWRSP